MKIITDRAWKDAFDARLIESIKGDTMTDEATPRPFSSSHPVYNAEDLHHIYGANGHDIVASYVKPIDAELIVRAVNEYDKSRRKIDSLVQVAKEALELNEILMQRNDSLRSSRVMKEIKEALKLAEVSNG